jgi:hypothetical protein
LCLDDYAYIYYNHFSLFIKEYVSYLIPKEGTFDITQASSIQSLLDSKVSQNEVVKSYIDSTSLTLREKLEMQQELNTQTRTRWGMHVYADWEIKPEIKLNNDEILKISNHALTMPERYQINRGLSGTGHFVQRHCGNGHYVVIKATDTVIRDFGHL